MRFGSFTYVVVLFGAGLAGTLVNVTRSAEPGPDPLAGPPKVVTWADPHAADVSAELDAARAVVRARIGERVALAAALVRGERTLEDVAERFKELNAEVPAAAAALADDYPSAGPDEIAYRQVVAYVRARVRAGSGRAPAVLATLETEVARRFPAASPRPGV